MLEKIGFSMSVDALLRLFVSFFAVTRDTGLILAVCVRLVPPPTSLPPVLGLPNTFPPLLPDVVRVQWRSVL